MSRFAVASIIALTSSGDAQDAPRAADRQPSPTIRLDSGFSVPASEAALIDILLDDRGPDEGVGWMLVNALKLRHIREDALPLWLSAIRALRTAADRSPAGTDVQFRWFVIHLQTELLRFPATREWGKKALSDKPTRDAQALLEAIRVRDSVLPSEHMRADAWSFGVRDAATYLRAAGRPAEAAQLFKELASFLDGLPVDIQARNGPKAALCLSDAAACELAMDRVDDAVRTVSLIDALRFREDDRPAGHHALLVAAEDPRTFRVAFAEAWLDTAPWDAYSPQFVLHLLTAAYATGARKPGDQAAAFRALDFLDIVLDQHHDLVELADSLVAPSMPDPIGHARPHWMNHPVSSNLLVTGSLLARDLRLAEKARTLAHRAIDEFPEHPSAASVSRIAFAEASKSSRHASGSLQRQLP